MYLVDTSAWIDFLRKREDRLTPYLESKEAHVSDIILFELLSGVPLSGQRSFLNYLSLFGTLTMTRDIVLQAAEIATTMRSKRVFPQTTDMLIASTALFYKATLIHKDKDFEVIKNFCPLKTIRFL